MKKTLRAKGKKTSKSKLESGLSRISNKAKAGLAGLALATVVGTFGGNEGGLPPFYNNKVGTWGGINVGFFTEYNPGSKFYGISLSAGNISKKNAFYGVEANFFNDSNSRDFYGVEANFMHFGEVYNKISGVQAGVFNLTEGKSKINGAQVGVFNMNLPNLEVSGTQIGVVNMASKINGVQIGLLNYSDKRVEGFQVGISMSTEYSRYRRYRD